MSGAYHERKAAHLQSMLHHREASASASASASGSGGGAQEPKRSLPPTASGAQQPITSKPTPMETTESPADKTEAAAPHPEQAPEKKPKQADEPEKQEERAPAVAPTVTDADKPKHKKSETKATERRTAADGRQHEVEVERNGKPVLHPQPSSSSDPSKNGDAAADEQPDEKKKPKQPKQQPKQQPKPKETDADGDVEMAPDEKKEQKKPKDKPQDQEPAKAKTTRSQDKKKQNDKAPEEDKDEEGEGAVEDAASRLRASSMADDGAGHEADIDEAKDAKRKKSPALKPASAPKAAPKSAAAAAAVAAEAKTPMVKAADNHLRLDLRLVYKKDIREVQGVDLNKVSEFLFPAPKSMLYVIHDNFFVRLSSVLVAGSKGLKCKDKEMVAGLVLSTEYVHVQENKAVIDDDIGACDDICTYTVDSLMRRIGDDVDQEKSHAHYQLALLHPKFKYGENLFIPIGEIYARIMMNLRNGFDFKSASHLCPFGATEAEAMGMTKAAVAALARPRNFFEKLILCRMQPRRLLVCAKNDDSPAIDASSMAGALCSYAKIFYEMVTEAGKKNDVAAASAANGLGADPDATETEDNDESDAKSKDKTKTKAKVKAKPVPKPKPKPSAAAAAAKSKAEPKKEAPNKRKAEDGDADDADDADEEDKPKPKPVKKQKTEPAKSKDKKEEPAGEDADDDGDVRMPASVKAKAKPAKSNPTDKGKLDADKLSRDLKDAFGEDDDDDADKGITKSLTNKKPAKKIDEEDD